MNTFKQENRLLTTLMERWGSNPEKSWGYITTGGTEGVTKGITHGYECLRNRGYTNILVVHSDAAHYCVPKAASLVATSCNKVKVGVTDNNDMCLAELDDFLHSARVLNVEAILLNVTLGTTFFGGCDDIDMIRSLFAKNGYGSKTSYIHVDAALHGGFWQDDASTRKYTIGRDFDSISISGHKWFGGFVAGCFLATKYDDKDVGDNSYIEYAGLVDKFISGSRSGASACLWIARLLQFDWKVELARCHANRDYLVGALQELGLTVAKQYVNVLIPRPSEGLAKRWQLMCVGDEAQVLILPHASREYLKEFVEDIHKDIVSGEMRLPTGRLERLANSE